NILNSLAVLAVSDFLGIDFDIYRQALAGFSGVARCFTVRGEAGGVMVVDDYGHHPAEIRATLAGARSGFPERRVVLAFQPHRFTRTRDLMDEFARAFNEAEVVAVCDIYGAGEDAIEGITSARLVEEMRAQGHRGAVYVPKRADIAGILGPRIHSGD